MTRVQATATLRPVLESLDFGVATSASICTKLTIMQMSILAAKLILMRDRIAAFDSQAEVPHFVGGIGQAAVSFHSRGDGEIIVRPVP
mgnify:CR=1 FL=1